MPRRLPLFETLWNAYPHGQAADVKKRIGGNVNADWITNTCTIRISHCFNEAGDPIPRSFSGLETVSGANGQRYAFREREFNTYMRGVYGPPTLTHTYPGGAGGEVPEAFKRTKGIISFDVAGWADATGHFDCWNGEKAAHGEYFNRARKVMLWEAPDMSTVFITASVGAGGRNKRSDTRSVQLMLKDHGHDVGPVDGACGPRTVAAIRAFQEAAGLLVDGRVDVGGATWAALNR